MNNYTTSDAWILGGDPMKDMRDAIAKLPPAPPSPFASLFRSPWPLYVDPKLPEDSMYLFSRPFGLGLLMHPKHVVRAMDVISCGLSGEELRCGPFMTPSGKQWAVVMDLDTRSRKVVDWPREGVAA